MRTASRSIRRVFALTLLFAPISLCRSVFDVLGVTAVSFGATTPLSSDGQNIQNWHILTSEGHRPEILSDRIILTPPYPGNMRSAIWSSVPFISQEWTAEMFFRATGQERSGGSLNLWFASNGEMSVEQSSVYTVGKFDGLVLTLDQHGGRGGALRGFLNDGAVEYKTNPNVDSLAFGHCDFAYRDSGRFVSIEVISGQRGLEVRADGRKCFATEKISLPTGYNFGITAASADTPDSFEISKFEVTLGATPSPPDSQQQPPRAIPHVKPLDTQDQHTQQSQPNQQAPVTNPGNAQDIADIKHTLFALQDQVQTVYNDLSRLSQEASTRHGEFISHQQANAKSPITHERIEILERKLTNIEGLVNAVKNDVEGKDYREHLGAIQRAVSETREGLLGDLPGMFQTHGPRMGFLIFIVIGSQVVLAVSYVVYKRRRANAPKKFL